MSQSTCLNQDNFASDLKWFNEQRLFDLMGGLNGRIVEALERKAAEHCYWKHPGYRDRVREVTKCAQRVQRGGVNVEELEVPTNIGNESQHVSIGLPVSSGHGVPTPHCLLKETDLMFVITTDLSHTSAPCY